MLLIYKETKICPYCDHTARIIDKQEGFHKSAKVTYYCNKCKALGIYEYALTNTSSSITLANYTWKSGTHHGDKSN